MEKFQNRYRIPSARAAWWDYSSPGKYFITICTAFRECIFGKITDKRMILSEAGKIVLQEWIKSFKIRSELSCDTFVIMPNHLHAILCIGASSEVTDIKTPIENHGVAYRSPKSISSFVGGFKSAATTRINELRKTPYAPVWQTRFHDHIIRDETEYQRIYWYIRNNPKNWKEDKFHH